MCGKVDLKVYGAKQNEYEFIQMYMLKSWI